MQHHEAAIERYLTRQRDRPDVLGVLLAGSVARGDERPDSDIDLVLVVSPQAWDRAVAELRVMTVDTEGADYPGGYFDVKLATAGMLHAAARQGDGPVRSSLAAAKVLLDRGAGLDAALIAVREASKRPAPELTAAFVAQCRLHGEYFLDAGLQHGDPLLIAHAAVHLATSAGRAALAAAGVPFPGPKQLMHTLRSIDASTSELANAIDDLVTRPDRERGDRVLALVDASAGGSLPRGAELARFVLDNEYAWFTGIPAPEYR